MLTADTITDEQIRELRESYGLCANEHCYAMCGAALRDPSYTPEFQRDSRARCAEILNARNTEVA